MRSKCSFIYVCRIDRNLPKPPAKSSMANSFPSLLAPKMTETDGMGYPSPEVTALRLR